MVQNKHSFFENLLFKPIVKLMVLLVNAPLMEIPHNRINERLTFHYSHLNHYSREGLKVRFD